MRPPLSILLVALVLACAAERPVPAPAAPYWKGNTHTHTLWSDGDAAPEEVVAAYQERGYHFLVLSDHHVLSRGERWVPVQVKGRLQRADVERLSARFGAERVALRQRDGIEEMRLLTLDELRARFEVPGRMLLIEGQELTDRFEDRPVHVNGLNLAEAIPPPGGASVREVLENNVRAVIEQGLRLGRPTLAHVNHPNFGWGLTWEDVAAVASDRFFEVYNGHSAVRNHGDHAHPSMEELWDRALVARLKQLGLGLLYGVATDDAHNFSAFGAGKSNPGRGWIHVRAPRLETGEILAAMRRGDFYASTGVELADVASDGRTYRVDIAAEPGVEYTTRFLGYREGSAPGLVLAERQDDPAVYIFAGDELYVRAVVVSSRLHPNPYAVGDHEQAWTQPVQPAAR